MDKFTLSAVIIAIGYLLGSIPWGWIVGKTRGIDIRQHGSGNTGATNVYRTIGRKWGVLVFVLDALKGTASVRLGMLLAISCKCGEVGFSPEIAGILGAIGCFLGHCFPVWLRFRGGKGVAPGAGIYLGLAPLTVGLALVVWGGVFLITRYVSLASLAAALSLPFLLWAISGKTGILFWATVILCLLAIWRHRENIQRLCKGTENRFK